MLFRLVAALRVLKGWKTIATSVAIAVAGVLQTTDWATVVEPQDVGPTLLVIGIVVAVLRAVTNTPLGRK